MWCEANSVLGRILPQIGKAHKKRIRRAARRRHFGRRLGAEMLEDRHMLNAAPTAEAGGPYTGQVGDTIMLSAAGSADPDGTIAAYAWDLDNDTQYDDASGAATTFAASTVGAFTVGLQVTDDDGATGTDLATVTVSEASHWTHAKVDDEASAFFDDSYVHEIHITFDNQDWYNVLYDSHANDPDDPYFEADFECDGIVIENVGVRFKGNASFSIPGVKKSLKIDFDEFDEDNDAADFPGIEETESEQQLQ